MITIPAINMVGVSASLSIWSRTTHHMPETIKAKDIRKSNPVPEKEALKNVEAKTPRITKIDIVEKNQALFKRDQALPEKDCSGVEFDSRLASGGWNILLPNGSFRFQSDCLLTLKSVAGFSQARLHMLVSGQIQYLQL